MVNIEVTPMEKWVPTEEDFTTNYDGVILPFIEDESARIYGFGHQDKEQFARLVNKYDQMCSMGESDFVTSSSDVKHLYAYVTDHLDCRFKWRDKPQEGDFPITLTENR